MLKERLQRWQTAQVVIQLFKRVFSYMDNKLKSFQSFKKSKSIWNHSFFFLVSVFPPSSASSARYWISVDKCYCSMRLLDIWFHEPRNLLLHIAKWMYLGRPNLDCRKQMVFLKGPQEFWNFCLKFPNFRSVNSKSYSCVPACLLNGIFDLSVPWEGLTISMNEKKHPLLAQLISMQLNKVLYVLAM